MKTPFFRKKRRTYDPPALLQTGRGERHPFGVMDRYVPLGRCENALYDAIREAVPVVDAALDKIMTLTGGFSVKCGNAAMQTLLDDFAANVPVGGTQRGLDAFITRYLEQMLMYGTAVGEILPTASGRTVAALHNVPLRGLELERDAAHGGGRLCVRRGGQITPVPYPELLVVSALNPKPGQLQGTSLLQGLPFVTDILLKIFNTVGVNFERIGNVRFAVTYKPSKEAGERAFAKERAQQMAEEWQKAMRRSYDGRVSDFIAVGDVDIKVIGAENPMIDSSVPARQMLEQIVAKTGIPPFMLGLSWNATERMSLQQADMLTSQLWGYRRQLTPVITAVCETFLRMHGDHSRVTVDWNEISLQDEVAAANAAYTRARTRLLEKQLEEENG